MQIFAHLSLLGGMTCSGNKIKYYITNIHELIADAKMSNYKTVNIEQICFLIQAKKRDSLDVSKYHILLYILIQEQSITNVDFNMVWVLV